MHFFKFVQRVGQFQYFRLFDWKNHDSLTLSNALDNSSISDFSNQKLTILRLCPTRWTIQAFQTFKIENYQFLDFVQRVGQSRYAWTFGAL